MVKPPAELNTAEGLQDSSLGFKDVAHSFDYLVGGFAPSLSFSVNFLERVDDVLVMEGDVWLTESGAVACIKSCVPLLVFVPEANDHHVGLFDQGPGTN